MKYCISCRQPLSVLKNADEILIDYNDFNYIYNLTSEFSTDKTYIIRIRKDDEVDWKELHTLSQGYDLQLALEDLKMSINCLDLKYYWAYPITNFYELNGIIQMGVSSLFISGPLYFDLEKICKYNLPIRVIANACNNSSIYHSDGICGTYIRPEDIKVYEKYIDVIEFQANSLKKEETLLKIYQKEEWPGNLNRLLDNFNRNVDNRGIPIEFGETRANCRQSCQRDGRCHFCYTAINFADIVDKNQEKWEEMKESYSKTKEDN